MIAATKLGWLSFAMSAVILLISSPAFAVCTSPAGNEGDVTYSSTVHIMAYCNGTNWVAMGSSTTATFGTLTTGDLCTATSGSAIACTTGVGTGVLTALGNAVNSAGGFVDLFRRAWDADERDADERDGIAADDGRDGEFAECEFGVADGEYGIRSRNGDDTIGACGSVLLDGDERADLDHRHGFRLQQYFERIACADE